MSLLSFNKVLVAISVGVMSSLATAAVTLSNAYLHSRFVILNIYANGSSDWAMNATALFKSVFGLMFLIFCVGLALGMLLTHRDQVHSN